MFTTLQIEGSNFHIRSKGELNFMWVVGIIELSDIHILGPTGVYVSNVSLHESTFIWEGNSSVQVIKADVTMGKKSKFSIFNSTVDFKNVNFHLSNDSQLIFNNIEINGNFDDDEIKMIQLKSNASLMINGNNSDRLSCNMTDSITIPENALYTEADISGLLVCAKSAVTHQKMPKVHFERTNAMRMPRKWDSIHYDTCAIGEITSTRQMSSMMTTEKLTTSGSERVVIGFAMVLFLCLL